MGLFVFVDFKPNIGSMGEHGHQFMKHLTQLGESVVALAPRMAGDEKFDETCGYPVIRYSTRQFDSSGGLKSRLNRATLFRALNGAVRKIKPDYLICNLWGPQTGVSMALVSKLNRLPWFLFAHGEEFNRPMRWPAIRQITVRNSLRVICVSNYTRSLIETLGVYLQIKIDVVLNGFEYEQVADISQSPSHMNFLVYSTGLSSGATQRF